MNMIEIPVHNAGSDWPVDALNLERERTQALLASAAKKYPRSLLKAGDALSRRWLERHASSHLHEIDAVAARLGHPGAYFLNVNYEWGCSTRAAPARNGQSAQLTRILDWPLDGLGRYVIALRIEGQAGPWITLTWPGFTGVLQAMAPGRFSAAINQAPLRRTTGVMPLDWAVVRYGVWNRPHVTPAHLMRRVFEQARDYKEAREMLTKTPIALPALFVLAGIDPSEGCVIERREEEARVFAAPASAANHWQTPEWDGYARGRDSHGRADAIEAAGTVNDSGFSWLKPPVLNRDTRLAMIADAASGRLLVQGFEVDGPVTRPLSLAS